MIFCCIVTRNWPHDKFLENDFFQFWNVIIPATISYLAFVLEMHSKRNPIHPSRSKQSNFRLYTPYTCMFQSIIFAFFFQNVYSMFDRSSYGTGFWPRLTWVDLANNYDFKIHLVETYEFINWGNKSVKHQRF